MFQVLAVVFRQHTHVNRALIWVYPLYLRASLLPLPPPRLRLALALLVVIMGQAQRLPRLPRLPPVLFPPPPHHPYLRQRHCSQLVLMHSVERGSVHFVVHLPPPLRPPRAPLSHPLQAAPSMIFYNSLLQPPIHPHPHPH